MHLRFASPTATKAVTCFLLRILTQHSDAARARLRVWAVWKHLYHMALEKFSGISENIEHNHKIVLQRTDNGRGRKETNPAMQSLFPMMWS